MSREIVIDREKCLRCGKCVKDCMVKAIGMDDGSGLPVMTADGGKICIDCQHCLAVCPVGAISVNGVSPEECRPAGELPSAEKMLNLISQRRSIRRFRKEKLSPEIMAKLTSVLHWTPTGCNDHRLRFFIAGPEEIAAFRKISDRWLRFLIKSGLLSLALPRFHRYFKDILNGADIIYRNAPHLIIVMAPAKAPCCRTDQVIALTQFDLMAQSLGVGTCWCGFAEYAFRLIPALRRLIGCPAGYRIGGAMLFGKPMVEYCRATNPSKFEIADKIRQN